VSKTSRNSVRIDFDSTNQTLIGSGNVVIIHLCVVWF